MSPFAFRCLVAASIALHVCAGSVDLFLPSLIPMALARAAEAEPIHPVFDRWWFTSLLVCWLAVVIAGAGGLVLFKRWARTLSLWSTVLGLAFYSVMGTGAYSGLSSAFTEAASLLWGAALAIALFSPLRERFTSITNDA
jgi:hypothetical protein